MVAPPGAELIFIMNPFPGITLEIVVVAGAPCAQVTPAVGTVSTGVNNIVLLAVTEVVEALWVVVVAVKNPATEEPNAAGVEELEPIVAVLKSVTVNNEEAVIVAEVIAPVELTPKLEPEFPVVDCCPAEKPL